MSRLLIKNWNVKSAANLKYLFMRSLPKLKFIVLLTRRKSLPLSELLEVG